MDKYNAQEPRTVNTIYNGNITLLCIPKQHYYTECPKKPRKTIEITYG